MKNRWPLSTSIFLLAFLNVLLIGAIFVIFARVEFRFDLSSFLLEPARDRIMSVSRQIALDLPTTTSDNWTQILSRFSKSYPAEFYLFNREGKQLAGNRLQLPVQLQHLLATDPFAHPSEREPPPPPPAGSHPGGPLLVADENGQGYWILVHIPIWSEFGKEPAHGLLLWRVQSLVANRFYFDYRPWLDVLLAVIALSVICWWPFVQHLTRSIRQLTRATGQIAAGRFDLTLDVKRKDELGLLSQSISQMAHRLSELVNGQRRFLSDIAHELCSPISRIQAALGILEQRTQGGQLDYVKDVRDDVEHMSNLVNELLSFSKAQMSPHVDLLPVNVADAVTQVIKREASDKVDIRTDINQHLAVIAHPEYLMRSLSNIVRNAVRYAGDLGPVLISARNGDGQIKITVADSGPGVPDSELQHLLKPFYRPDEARQRHTGGTGLGLAIVKTCIDACGGDVHCRNRSPHGLEVEICLRAA